MEVEDAVLYGCTEEYGYGLPTTEREGYEGDENGDGTITAGKVGGATKLDAGWVVTTRMDVVADVN